MRVLSKFSLMLLLLGVAACAPTVSSTSIPARAPMVKAVPSEPIVAGKVALLLPLSGPQAALGQSLLNAAQLALFEVGSAQLQLRPLDTTGTPMGAQQAARQAMEEGAALVIGPVFSAEVSAVLPLTRSRNVAMLALSNNKQLAAADVYIMGQAPDDQLVRLLRYARGQGINKVAALLPATPYGDSIEAALTTSAQESGLGVVTVQRMAPGADPAMVAPALASAIAAAGGVDAIVLGEGAARTPALAKALREAGITARLLGTAQWEQIGADPAIAGSWYAAIAPEQRRAFQKRYEQTYATAPAPIASLGYDATALAAVLTAARKPFTRPELQRAAGFAGVDGIFRLNPDGLVERGLAVYEIGPAGIRTIDPAPQRFSDLTN
jgi:branched-chain amino acid transport system substrate-binding protein